MKAFWKAHYFDWLLFMRRGSIYGVAGGLVLGTVLFGSPGTSVLRIVSSYHRNFTMTKTDPHNVNTSYFVNH